MRHGFVWLRLVRPLGQGAVLLNHPCPHEQCFLEPSQSLSSCNLWILSLTVSFAIITELCHLHNCPSSSCKLTLLLFILRPNKSSSLQVPLACHTIQTPTVSASQHTPVSSHPAWPRRGQEPQFLTKYSRHTSPALSRGWQQLPPACWSHSSLPVCHSLCSNTYTQKTHTTT